MKEISKTNLVRQSVPGCQARMALKDDRILDVVNDRCFDGGTNVILRDKTVLPALYITHCHLVGSEATMVAGLSDIRQIKRYGEQQKANRMAECFARGIIHVRGAWYPALRENKALMERISKGEKRFLA